MTTIQNIILGKSKKAEELEKDLTVIQTDNLVVGWDVATVYKGSNNVNSWRIGPKRSATYEENKTKQRCL